MQAELEQVQYDLIDAEADLADRMAEIHAFEARVEARLGRLTDRLGALEAEIRSLQEELQDLRDQRIFGSDRVYTYRHAQRRWNVPPRNAAKPPAKPPSAATELQIKTLYRKLALEFHPDLAPDRSERDVRTQKMALINQAYAARDLTALLSHARGIPLTESSGPRIDLDQSSDRLVTSLRAEIERCQRRKREIEVKMQTLHLHPSVQLSLDHKLASREGRDLIAEMASDLKRSIHQRTAERDYLKSQLDQFR